MTDLSIKLAGVEFKNPVWLASAEPTYGFGPMKRGIDAGAGAVIAKSLNVPLPEMEFLERMVRYCVLDENRQAVRRGKIPKSFTLYSHSCAPYDEDKWIEELEKTEKYAVQNDAHVIGSLFTMPAEDQARISKKMEQIGLKMLEIDAGCPHPTELRATGFVTVRDVDVMKQNVTPVTNAVSIPVFAKLSPMTTDLVTMAHCATNQCGAAGVTCHNRFMGFLIDIETGKPLLSGYAGVGGPWMLPISLRWVSKIHAAMPQVPILGSSGAYDWQDVVQFLMAGASVTEFCSTVMFKGYKVIADAVTGFGGFLEGKGYKNVQEIIGMATNAALTYEQIANSPEYATNPRKSSVDTEKCVECDKCIETCWFEAMERNRNGVYSVNLEKCKGCGNCEIVCPVGAINWVTCQR
jgi:dihydroorotate dehydrogenase/Pyruvate/2-oxoacid:ferredoxin oxidoreductase delta subunit